MDEPFSISLDFRKQMYYVYCKVSAIYSSESGSYPLFSSSEGGCMKSTLAGFVEKADSADTDVCAAKTVTATKESPDKLSASVLHMAKTITEARESPDRGFIPHRRF